MRGENLLFGHDAEGRDIFIADLRADPNLIFNLSDYTDLGAAFLDTLNARIDFEFLSLIDRPLKDERPDEMIQAARAKHGLPPLQ